MVGHRDEILRGCRQRVSDSVTDTGELDADVEIFFDEIAQALQHHELRTAADDPPSLARSEAAARLGRTPHHAGLQPSKVPFIFGAISHAIGQAGARHGLSIAADEYSIFNQCIDAGVATSIEQFWDSEKARRQRRVSERFGDLAHELRGALGNAALAFKLLRTGEVALGGRTASILANNLMRMEALVARTLSSVQLDTSSALELSPVNVATVLRHLQACTIPDRAISITLEVDESLHVNADEMLLTSAISNLLHNACRFSCDGARVGLSCRAEDHGVVIEVEDECGGLAPDELSELFSLFVSGGEHPQDLALAITKRATEAMDGRVYVENRPDHGCAFTLAFPLARPSRTSSGPPARTDDDELGD